MESQELLITFENETHTIGNLINNELLENPNVLFSAYKIIHPLKKAIQLQLIVLEDDPKQVVRDSIDNIIKKLENFDKAFDKN
jgi:DNA-directed RNA polymerase subunit L